VSDSPDSQGFPSRRAYSRLALGIAARLETLAGREDVRLVDLSQGGAHVYRDNPEPIKAGVLTWLRFEAFGEVVWEEDGHVGLKFDRLLPLTCLVETRQRAPSVVREEAMAGEIAARDWAAGKLDSSGS
jgi:predicted transcriptional regulator